MTEEDRDDLMKRIAFIGRMYLPPLQQKDEAVVGILRALVRKIDAEPKHITFVLYTLLWEQFGYGIRPGCDLDVDYKVKPFEECLWK